MKKLITIIGLFVLTSFVFAQPSRQEIDNYFKGVISEVSEDLDKKEASNLPVGLTSQDYDLSISVQDNLKRGIIEYKFKSNNLPFIQEYIDKFKDFNPLFSVGVEVNESLKIKTFAGLDLRFSLLKDMFLGSKLYGKISETQNVAHGFVYAGYKIPQKVLLENDTALVYVGADSGEVNLNNINFEKLKNKAKSLSLKDSYVVGIHYIPNLDSGKYSFSAEYSNDYILGTIHLRL